MRISHISAHVLAVITQEQWRYRGRVVRAGEEAKPRKILHKSKKQLAAERRQREAASRTLSLYGFGARRREAAAADGASKVSKPAALPASISAMDHKAARQEIDEALLLEGGGAGVGENGSMAHTSPESETWLYCESQTDPYVPMPVVDGTVPRNEFGMCIAMSHIPTRRIQPFGIPIPMWCLFLWSDDLMI